MKASVLIGTSVPEEVRPGIWEDVIAERKHLADVVQRTESFSVGGSIIPEYRTTTSVSVLSRGAVQVNYSDLRYVFYAGQRWAPSSAVIDWPRMTIYLGEVYDGPIPGGVAGDPGGI